MIKNILESQMKKLTQKTCPSNFLSSTDKWAIFLIPILLFLVLLRCTDRFDRYKEICANHLEENVNNITCWWVAPTAFPITYEVHELRKEYGEEIEHIIVSKIESSTEESLLFWEIVLKDNKVIYCGNVDEIYLYRLIEVKDIQIQTKDEDYTI